VYRLRTPTALAEKLNKSLLKKIEFTTIFSFFCSFCPVGSQIQGVAGLPLVVSTYSDSTQTTTMLLTSLLRVFNNSYFCVVFISEHPPCSNKISYWWITSIAIRSSSATKQHFGTPPLASYLGPTSPLSMVEFLTDLFRKITERLYRKHDTPIFDLLLTVHLSIFISVFNQLDAQNLFHSKFYFMPLQVSSTCARAPDGHL